MIDSIGAKHNPNDGIHLVLSQSHAWDSGIRKIQRMRPRQILSANLASLKDSKRYPKLDTILKIANASDGKLSNGKVGRIVKGSHTTDIEALADLAELFGLQPWQLLVEGLNPAALPVLVDAKFLTGLREVVAAQPDDVRKIPMPRASSPARKTARR